MAALGLIFIDFILVFKAFREISRFSKNSVSRAVLSPTWPILGRFWPPKRLQDGPQERTKTITKSLYFLNIFKIDFRSKISAFGPETCAASERKAPLEFFLLVLCFCLLFFVFLFVALHFCFGLFCFASLSLWSALLCFCFCLLFCGALV